MKNFSRVLRLALRYRSTLAASLACALAVAVLWGGNIGAVYPLLKVVLEGKTLQDWVAGSIREAEQNQRELTQRIARLEGLSGQTPSEQDALLRQWIDTPANPATPASSESKISRKRYKTLLEKTSIERQRPIAGQIKLAETRLVAEAKALGWSRRLKPYVDRYLPRRSFQTLLLITGFLLLGTVVKSLFLVGNNILVARLAELSTLQLRKLFYRRTLRMDMAAFDNQGTADLMSRFTYDMQSVSLGLTTLFGRLIREPLKMVACLVGAAFICWRLLILSLVIAPVAALLVRWVAKALKRANRRAMEEMAEIYSTLDETFRGIKIVKAFTSESRERMRFHRRSKQFYKQAMRIARYDSLSRPITEVLGIVSICMAILAGAWLVLESETHLLGIRMCSRPLDLAELLVFYGMLAGVADPIRKFSDVITRLQSAAAASDRIFERLDREPQVRDPARPAPPRRHAQELVFEGVDFAYQPGQPVLQQIDLRIGFGETIALVGPNGCGKSTLANLIPRFYDPTVGSIRMDGVPLREMRLRDLRSQISLVTQETLLFDDTILNNIRYGSPHARREDVIEAAKRAHAHRFIENELADGYDTLAGSMGNRLSGGQRQRIALARAILRDPAILILDEATSQVDLESEQAIQQVLDEFVRDRTTVIITHHMAVLALADQIVVMELGQILDIGPHEELLGRCELYRRLYQIEIETAGGGQGPPLAA